MGTTGISSGWALRNIILTSQTVADSARKGSSINGSNGARKEVRGLTGALCWLGEDFSDQWPDTKLLVPRLGESRQLKVFQN